MTAAPAQPLATLATLAAEIGAALDADHESELAAATVALAMEVAARVRLVRAGVIPAHELAAMLDACGEVLWFAGPVDVAQAFAAFDAEGRPTVDGVRIVAGSLDGDG